MHRRPPGFPASVLILSSLALIFLFSSGVSAQDVPYTTGTWDAAEFGNHRARIRVVSEADAVRARIPWRRRDRDPGKKNIIMVDLRLFRVNTTSTICRMRVREGVTRECNTPSRSRLPMKPGFSATS